MTKLEAWKAWAATSGADSLSTEFTLENSSHGRAFSFAWDAAHEACAALADAERKNIGVLLSYPAQSSAAYKIGIAIRARSNT